MSLTLDDAQRLQECLAGDGVALIPTDTVYGLACNPESESAVRRIYELKGRPAVKPAAVMFFAREPALASLSELGPRTLAALGTLLPGPVTLLLENSSRRFPLACDPGGGGGALLGLRVPLLQGPLAALAGVGVPAAQSSANFSGGADRRDLRNVPIELREGVDLVLDGGELPGVASTVIDLSDYERSGRWRVVRVGPLDAAFIQTALAGSC
ncbi:MAG: Sua5/YciO/YrdC/YwlC family protein [Solirubrobacteraceae bacterium]